MNNSFDDVIVEVAFAEMFFQLYRIYEWNYFVGNPVHNNLKIIFLKKSIEQKKKILKN